MSSHDNSPTPEPLDLSSWRVVPVVLMIVGGIGAVAGFFVDRTQFAYSWLLAFMFFLSLGLGGLGFTILHHLFDAAWSVPIRRVTEQMACLLRYMWFLWIPIGLLAPKLYKWMADRKEGQPDLSTKEKFPLFTVPGFWIVSVACLLVWFVLPTMLR